MRLFLAVAVMLAVGAAPAAAQPADVKGKTAGTVQTEQLVEQARALAEQAKRYGDLGGLASVTDSAFVEQARMLAAEGAAMGLEGKLLADRKVLLNLTDAARAWLGRVGYDPVYGARPLKRAVQRHLQDPLADLILRGDVKDGATVNVDEGDGKLALVVA